MLAKAPAHSTSPQADPPLSRAGSLPQGITGAHSIRTQHQTLWERACSRRRRHIQHHHKQTHRYREQARSHKRLQMPTAPGFNTKPCGSELAREDAGTSNITTSRPTAIASKGLRLPTASGLSTKPCGSELAREDAGTSNITTSRPTAIASKGLRVPTASGLNTKPCGNEPAREDAGTSNIDAS